MNQEGLTTEVTEITEEGKKCAQGRGEKGGVMEWWNDGMMEGGGALGRANLELGMRNGDKGLGIGSELLVKNCRRGFIPRLR